jgi:hypothetical protein
MSQTKAQLIEGSAASELTAAKTLLGAGSASAPSLAVTGDTNTGIYFPTADTIGFAEGGVEAARIDSSGRFLVGTSTARANVFNGAIVPSVQIEGTSFAQTTFSIVRNENIADSRPGIVLGKTRGASNGSNTVVQSGDNLGLVDFQGADGANLVSAARIDALVDGTPGTNDMPGRLVFSTTADGASSPTERMRIGNQGRITTTCVENNNEALILNHSGTSGQQYGLSIITANDQNDSTRYFINCVGASTSRFVVRSNGGIDNYSANNVNLSDRNVKKDISLAADTWDCLKEWEIVNFRYKDQPDDADLNLGVIAQQVAESCPEVITVFQEATEDQPEKLGVRDQQMMWMAIKALQEAQVRIETLEAEVAALKAS